MLWAILNKSWKQHPTKQQLYGHLPPISKTIQIRHVGHCWKSKGKLIRDVLLGIPLNRCASVGQPARIYLQQLCKDIGCSLEDLLGGREGWMIGINSESEAGKSMLAAYEDEIYIRILFCVVCRVMPAYIISTLFYLSVFCHLLSKNVHQHVFTCIFISIERALFMDGNHNAYLSVSSNIKYAVYSLCRIIRYYLSTTRHKPFAIYMCVCVCVCVKITKYSEDVFIYIW